MAKINSETLLRGDYLLLQNAATKQENLALSNHLQLSLFVPLPLPAPGSAPVVCMNIVILCGLDYCYIYTVQKMPFTAQPKQSCTILAYLYSQWHNQCFK